MDVPAVTRVYLCGPMSGIDAFNYPAFHAAAASLRALGYDVIDPSENDGGNTSLPWEHYLRQDLRCLLGCDLVATLPGWQGSRGASLEVFVATQVKIHVIELEGAVRRGVGVTDVFERLRALEGKPSPRPFAKARRNLFPLLLDVAEAAERMNNAWVFSWHHEPALTRALAVFVAAAEKEMGQ